MIVRYFVYAFAGKLLIFLFQKVFFDNYPSSRENFLTKLLSCGLCFGFWIYFALAFVFKIDILEIEYIIIAEFLSAAVTTFVVWLISLGWKSRFQEIVIE